MKTKIRKSFRSIAGRFSGKGLRKQFVLLNRLYMFFNGLLTPDSVVVGGHKMVLDPQDSLKLSSQGFYEPFLTGLVKQHTEPGDVVLDIGGNIGYYTLVFASLVGNEGKIYAFEPEPDLFKLLE